MAQDSIHFGVYAMLASCLAVVYGCQRDIILTSQVTQPVGVVWEALKLAAAEAAVEEVVAGLAAEGLEASPFVAVVDSGIVFGDVVVVKSAEEC